MKITRRHLLQGSAGLLAGAALVPPALAAEQVLKIIVGFPPGGSGDTFARLIAEQLRQELTSPVIVENKDGAGGMIAAETFLRAPADGYTMMLHTASSAVFATLVRKNPPYNPLTDFRWVAQLSVAPLVIVANPKLPVENLKTFLDYLKANPGRPYGSAGIGASTHFAAELLLDRAGGIQALHIPYRGSGPSITDTIAGNVTFMIETLQTTQQHHAAGTMKILAVLGENRIPAAPDIPTAREFGIDAVASTYNLLAAPMKAPKERVDALAKALSAAMNKPEFQKQLRSQGIEPVTASGPEQAQAFVASEVARWTPIAKKLNIEM